MCFLQYINERLETPFTQDTLDEIAKEIESRKSLPRFRNKDIIADLYITPEEVSALHIVSQREERKNKQQAKELRDFLICEMYRQRKPMEEIISKAEASKDTVIRVLQLYTTYEEDKKKEHEELTRKVLELCQKGYSKKEIAKCVGKCERTVFSILSLQKNANLYIKETKKSQLHQPEFSTQEGNDIYNCLYSVERKQSSVDNYQVALSKLQFGKRNILLCGSAGTGKSYLIQQYLNWMPPGSRKRTMVIAPTGKAASMLNGSTIHAAFGLSNGVQPNTRITENNPRLQNIDTIIIDEVSMLRIDIFNRIFRMVKYTERKEHRRIRFIVVGDFGQLAPVTTPKDIEQLKNNYPEVSGFYAFHSKQWDSLHFQKIVLTQVRRQIDPAFISHLMKLKYGSIGSLEWFNKNVRHYRSWKDCINNLSEIFICPTNNLVNQINQATAEIFYNELPTTVFTAEVSGPLLADEIPCPQTLKLTKYMRVMTICNENSYKNGTIGTIIETSDDGVKLLLEDDSTIWVTPKTFCLSNGTHYSQLPLVLASAITVNKAQGCTFDRVNIVATEHFFAPGQLYTALSRCRTLGGISIIGKLTPRDLIVDLDALRMTV